MIKVCTKCKVEKPSTEFTRRRNVYKGVETWSYKSHCKPCHAEDSKLAREANLDKAHAREKELREQRKLAMLAMTPDEKERHKQNVSRWNKTWRKANPDKVKEKRRVYQEANKERIAAKKATDAKTEHGRALDKARGKRYRAAHPERVYELHRIASTKRAPVAKQEARQKRVELRGSYVAQLLQMPTGVVPSELIEAERIRLKIKRMTRELDKNRTEKKCSTCRVYKPIILFSRFWKSKDGHSYECLICARERKRKDRHEKGLTYTPRKLDEFGRTRKHTPEELKAARTAYYYANIETIRARDRARNKHRSRQ